MKKLRTEVGIKTITYNCGAESELATSGNSLQ
jgi:hypothetical protein